MKEPLRILFSSAGRRVQLIDCFREDAAGLGIPIEVFATDANPAMSAACRSADFHVQVPRCKDPDFVPKTIEFCKTHHIKLLIPTIDTELEALSRATGEFLKCGTLVAISGSEVVSICRDKARTSRILNEHGVRTPKTVPLSSLREDPKVLSYPVIIKPVDGSSSIGLVKLQEPGDLAQCSAPNEGYIAQEFWTGKEYTVNIFFDQSHRLRAAVPHLRYETRAGEVSKGVTEKNAVLMSIAEKVGEALPGAFGALCFQAIVKANGEAAVFEINARFGGGYPLAWKAGAKFSKWLLEFASSKPSTITNEWEDRLTMLRYDSAIFLPSNQE